MALDEATADYVRRRAQSGLRPIQELSAQEAREFEAGFRELYGTGPEMRSVSDHVIAVAGGHIRLRVLVPNENPRGLVVYYHGGGWVTGCLEDFDVLGRLLAERTGCAVLLVEYRLAPEYRFPTAVEDAWRALVWAADNQESLVGGRVPLVVAGDSAGGNLAAVVAQRAAAAGGPRIALQVLIYPVVDCALDTTSYLAVENQLLLTRDTMSWCWDHYVPDPTMRTLPDASPYRARRLQGLPPAVVVTAEHDVLRDEGEAYAHRLVEAGVPVVLKRFKGQMHGFFTLVNLLPGSATSLEYVAREIVNALPASPPKEA